MSEHPLWSIAKSLKSIAQNLERIANPPEVHKFDEKTKEILAHIKPGSFTYVPDVK